MNLKAKPFALQAPLDIVAPCNIPTLQGKHFYPSHSLHKLRQLYALPAVSRYCRNTISIRAVQYTSSLKHCGPLQYPDTAGILFCPSRSVYKVRQLNVLPAIFRYCRDTISTQAVRSTSSGSCLHSLQYSDTARIPCLPMPFGLRAPLKQYGPCITAIPQGYHLCPNCSARAL